MYAIKVLSYLLINRNSVQVAKTYLSSKFNKIRMLGKKVKNIEIKKGQTVATLIKAFSDSGGFTAKKLAVASDIFKDMEKDKECVKFLSFPADVISTGLRGVIVDLVKNQTAQVNELLCKLIAYNITVLIGAIYELGLELKSLLS